MKPRTSAQGGGRPCAVDRPVLGERAPDIPGGGSSQAEFRQRDIFPLPLLPPRGPLPASVSVSVRRRVCRQRGLDQSTNEVIEVLNDIYGGSAASFEPTAAQRKAQGSLRRQVHLSCSNEFNVHGRAALSELLASDLPYDAGEASCKVRPYDRSLVSWPAVGASAPPLRRALDDFGRQVLDQFRTRMLVSSEEWGRIADEGIVIRPYMDEMLRKSAATYEDFVVDLWERNMISPTLEPLDIITPFFCGEEGGSIAHGLGRAGSQPQVPEAPADAHGDGRLLGQFGGSRGRNGIVRSVVGHQGFLLFPRLGG